MKKEDKLFPTDSRLDSVGIIMDGNGRWAKARGLARSAGHVAGARVVENVIRTFFELDVHYVTLYAFSTENWRRPKREVDTLMKLFYEYLDSLSSKNLKGLEFSLRFIGDKSPLSEKLRNKCIEIEEKTKGKPFVCNLAINYGGRAEIVDAVNRATLDGNTHFTEELLSRYMQTGDTPDPDLIIRTGGDFRTSNFLIWQSAYSEYLILDTLWPDFGREDILFSIKEFYKRRRRFGGLDREDRKEANI